MLDLQSVLVTLHGWFPISIEQDKQNCPGQFRTRKYSRILTLNIYSKWNTFVYKGI